MKKYFFLLIIPFLLFAEENYVKEHYTKTEYRVPMRDGATLFTVVYSPKDSTQKYPIMFCRTPYTVAPYGGGYKGNIGPSDICMNEKYIFVYQDVRGRFMSDGEYEDIRPYNPNKKSKKDIDESTDAFDTIEWLVKNVPNNNGKVGMWGISYPGFYAAQGLINSHPALKAVSPQAPVTDWFIGDDFHHKGVVFLVDAFNFYRSFGKPRPQLTTTWPPGFQYPTPDAYKFLLQAGSLASIKQKYYGDTSKFWNDVFNHPNYDEFWKARAASQFYKNVKPAVLVVGGWFDAEDLFGTLQTYQDIERMNPNAKNSLVMGPWFHGGWARSKGDRLGNISFENETAPWYREEIEAKFFRYYLKGIGSPPEKEAYVFETGSNEWKTYDSWPPKNRELKKLYFSDVQKLSFVQPNANSSFDEYVSDPNKPVPYIDYITNDRGREYMTDDQRFAWQRPDVVSYEMKIEEKDITIAGPIQANLFVSTTGSDADFVVKLIDVFPDSTKDDSHNAPHIKMGGYQMLVRGEIMRARYRNSFEKPEPMIPNKIEKVSFTLPDVNHTFKKGHTLMVQVQSSWFPLADRNPQKFVNVYEAKESDFQKATHRIYRTTSAPSNIEVGILK